MPDINPADLSRPSISSTPIISTKALAGTAFPKVPKTSQIIPLRIDLEPIYTALKATISPEQWLVYKEATTQFFIGRLNQVEFSGRIDPIIVSQNGEKEHLHNQLLAAIYGNVTREMPDQGLAPWVSTNDKPTAATGPKPVTGDAAERRLKGEVMQLPGRDRRRIKDLIHNQVDPRETFASVLTEHHRAKVAKPVTEAPASAGGLNGMNFDSEIRKKYTQTLAVESGEFPDTSHIEGRMLPMCYDAGLTSGHSQDASQYMSVATESFVKEMLSNLFGRTRCNGPGDSGSSGFGSGAAWVQTSKYKRQLGREEHALMRGETQRDKGGLLPVESKAASERGPLSMADLRLALELGEPSLSHFPVIGKSLNNTYREGELEDWDNFTFLDGRDASRTTESSIPRTNTDHALTNGELDDTPDVNAMEVDDEAWWDGGVDGDVEAMDNVLDSCLAVS